MDPEYALSIQGTKRRLVIPAEPANNVKSTVPDVLLESIFSYLPFASLPAAYCVNKQWNTLKRWSALWKTALFKEVAFGCDSWVKHFGKGFVSEIDKEKEFSSFPRQEYMADCKNMKNIFPDINPKEVLKIAWIPKGLTIRCLGTALKKYFPDNNDGYRFIEREFLNPANDPPIEKSGWRIMMLRIVPGSNEKIAERAHEIFDFLTEKGLQNYDFPETTEAAGFLITQYASTKKRYLNNDPCKATRCKEGNHEKRSAVGVFDADGPTIHYAPNNTDPTYGVAPIRRFEESL